MNLTRIAYGSKRVYLKKLKTLLRQALEDLWQEAHRGVDMWCAEAVIKVKNKYPEKNIKLVLAIPFLKYAGYFSEDEKRRLTKIIDESDERILTSAENDTSSAVAKYYRRNEYMVDNSSRVIAVYEDGKSIKGGTRYTIEYAKKQGCEIILIRWDSEYKKGSVVDFEAR